MSRRRLERGYWNGRCVRITEKEHGRIFRLDPSRGRWVYRREVRIILNYPYPVEIQYVGRAPRKVKKAMWKRENWYGYGRMHKGVTELRFDGSSARVLSSKRMINKKR